MLVETRKELTVKYGMIGLFCVFVILPLVILLISNITYQEITISEEEALTSNISSELKQTIEERYDDDVDNYVMHEISQKGDYTIVLIVSLLPDNYADNSLMIAQKNEDNYTVLYNGQIYTRDILKEAGVPNNIIDEVFNKEKIITKYLASIANASVSPANKYPLISLLPYSSDDLYVSYSYDDNMDVPTIEINAIDAVDRGNALTVIRELCECELGEYNLKYNNFTNPFTGGNR